jgi:hypothetical protein
MAYLFRMLPNQCHPKLAVACFGKNRLEIQSANHLELHGTVSGGALRLADPVPKSIFSSTTD